MTRFFLLLLFIFLTDELHAQPYIDLAGIQYQYSPDGSIAGSGNNPLETHYIQANVNVPLKIYRNDLLLINPSFEMTRLDFKNDVSQDFNLYGLTMALSYVKQWKNKKWKTVFVSVDRLSSDFKNLTIKHFQPGAAVLMIYEKNPKIKFKFGVYYNAEFFGAFVLPLIGADWKINDRLILHGIFPRNAVLEYRLTSSIYAGINWRAITNSYRYKSYNTNDYFKLEENQLHLFSDFYLTKHFVFNVEAGHTFLRQLNRRSEFQRLAGLDSDLSINEGYLFKIGFFYRVRL